MCRAESIIRGRRPVFVSDLTEVELISALSRKVRTREFSAEEAAAIRNHFVSHLEQGVYRRTFLGTHHVLSARELLSTFSTPLRTLDALHLAPATSENLQLVTADKVFAQAARKSSLKATVVSSASK